MTMDPTGWMIDPMEDDYVPEASRQILVFENFEDADDHMAAAGGPVHHHSPFGSSSGAAAGGPDADGYLVPLMPLVVSGDGGVLRGSSLPSIAAARGGTPSAQLEPTNVPVLPGPEDALLFGAAHSFPTTTLGEAPSFAWPAGMPVAVAIAAAAAALPEAAGLTAALHLTPPPPPLFEPAPAAHRQQAATGQVKKPRKRPASAAATPRKRPASAPAADSSRHVKQTAAAQRLIPHAAASEPAADDGTGQSNSPAAATTGAAAEHKVQSNPSSPPLQAAEVIKEEEEDTGDAPRRPRRAAAQRLLDAWKLNVLAAAAADANPKGNDDEEDDGSGEDGALGPLDATDPAVATRRQHRRKQSRGEPNRAPAADGERAAGEEVEMLDTSSWEGEEETESSDTIGSDSRGQRPSQLRRSGSGVGAAARSGSGAVSDDVPRAAVDPASIFLKPRNFKVDTSATSTFKGVTRHKNTGKFEAHMWDGTIERPGDRKRPRGKQVYLGSFLSEEEAARVYDVAALLLLPEGAPLNYNPEDYDLSSFEGLSRSEQLQQLRRTGAPRSQPAEQPAE